MCRQIQHGGRHTYSNETLVSRQLLDLRSGSLRPSRTPQIELEHSQTVVDLRL